MSETRISHRDAIFGQTVVLLRKRYGLEQGDLAERSGMSRAALSRIERGDSSATIHAMTEIASGLGITLGQLVNEYEGAEEILKTQNVQIVSKAEAKNSGSALALVGLAALAILLAKK
ncbi:Helix-turn-helix [Aliiroseovarius crassostreae]|nr:helix-turn-helix transcriptional regulator [Aliiroseovarius crassostreae]SFU58294.1 Helix-turn-helix [Aliiroseovarius crassostreae]